MASHLSATNLRHSVLMQEDSKNLKPGWFPKSKSGGRGDHGSPRGGGQLQAPGAKGGLVSKELLFGSLSSRCWPQRMELRLKKSAASLPELLATEDESNGKVLLSASFGRPPDPFLL